MKYQKYPQRLRSQWGQYGHLIVRWRGYIKGRPGLDLSVHRRWRRSEILRDEDSRAGVVRRPDGGGSEGRTGGAGDGADQPDGVWIAGEAVEEEQQRLRIIVVETISWIDR